MGHQYQSGVGMFFVHTVALDGTVTSRITSEAGDVREPAWSPFPATQ